ncbi:MAG: hypothetical protein WBQ66_18820 [Blastocatellia bacterium]
MSNSDWQPPVFDPIRYCVFTTVAIIAWVFSPPVAVVLMSGMGLWAYVDAYRKGLRESKCLLRDPRIVMVYLALAFVAGITALVVMVIRLLP